MLQVRTALVQIMQHFGFVQEITLFHFSFFFLLFHFSSSVSQDTIKDESLRDDVRFYFMNPCEKYQARKHIPWKLGVQVLKIILVTTQVRTQETGDGHPAHSPRSSVLSGGGTKSPLPPEPS